MNDDLVSVIMSTCNTSDDYLLLAVRSILEQTYSNLELIVIFDGGKYSKGLSEIKDKRLKIIKHKNRLGLATRLNEGILLANGKYIARMDSDDYALPDRIEKQLNFMNSHQEVDICSMFSKNFGDSKKVRVSACTANHYIKAELFLNCILIHPTIMFRKSSIEKYNIKYNEGFLCTQDYELWTRLIKKCTFAILPEIGIFYRKHNKQISINRKKEQVYNRDVIIQRNLSNLGFHELETKQIEIIQKTVSHDNIKEACYFIDKCISRNKINPTYDEKALKNVLYRHLFTTALKNKRIFVCMKVLRPYDIYYLLATVFLVQKCNFQVLKFRKIYKELMKRGYNAK